MPVSLRTTGAALDDLTFRQAADSLSPSFYDTAGTAFTSGFLDSLGAGTVVRDMSIPNGAPTSIPAPGPRSLGPSRPTDWLEQTRQQMGAMTEDEWKSSPYFRDNIPWDPSMTRARAEALAEWNDYRKVQEDKLARTDWTVTKYAFGLAGAATDPVNFIPVLGPTARAAAAARAGRVVGGALVSSADAVINTAVATAATYETRQSLGDDTSFEKIALDLASAALIGGVFGGIAGKLEDMSFKRQMAAIKNVQTSEDALREATSSLAVDGQVKLNEPIAARLTQVADEAVARVGTTGQVLSPTPRTPLDPDTFGPQLRDLRARGETEYAFSQEAVFDPNPYKASYDRDMSDLPDEVNDKFQVHGMAATTDGRTVDAKLLELLNEGLDPNRTINSGPPKGGTLGVNSTRSDAPYLLVSNPGEDLMQTGIKNVIVQGPAEANLPVLRGAYPEVNFMTPREARRWMEASTAQPPKTDTTVPPPREADPAVVREVAQAEKSAVTRAAPSEDLQDLGIEIDGATFPEMDDLKALIDQRELETGQPSALRTELEQLDKMVQRTAKEAKGLEAAMYCALRN